MNHTTDIIISKYQIWTKKLTIYLSMLYLHINDNLGQKSIATKKHLHCQAYVHTIIVKVVWTLVIIEPVII